MQSRPHRRRGVVLTLQGQQKLQAEIIQAERQENHGQKFSLEALSGRTGLDTSTVAKALSREAGVDKSTLTRFFQAFGLQLDPSDYASSDSIQIQPVAPDRPARASSRVDLGEALDVSIFYGRSNELEALQQSIVVDRCRLVVIWGMGGIGKSSLVARLAHEIQGEFEYVIWRSLKDTPPFEEVLASLLQFLTDCEPIEAGAADTVARHRSRLIECLRNHRCLVILDNAESVLQEGESEGYKPGYENFGVLLTRLGEIPHQSCVLLTSRENFKPISVMEGEEMLVRSLMLSGLTIPEAQHLLQAKGLPAFTNAATPLIRHYQGNPLALKIVSTRIREVFNGDISRFLDEKVTVFGDIYTLLDSQFSRLSEFEKSIMYWLAIEREPLSIDQLRQAVIVQGAASDLQESLSSLINCSLLEKGTGQRGTVVFTLQPVVMEYVIKEFIGRSFQEIVSANFYLLRLHSLIQAQASEYVREAQIRLIMTPLKNRLIAHFGSDRSLHQHLSLLLAAVRNNSTLHHTYLAGNLLNLLCQSGADLTGYDLSHLTIWQACLQDVSLHRVNLTQADVSKSIFIETLETILALAFSPDGKLLATGDATSDVRIWRLEDRKQYLRCPGHSDWIRSVAFHPDGSILASGSGDRTIKLWDINTGQCLKTLEGHSDRVRSVKFSVNGELLFSSSVDRTVRVWDIKTRTCLHVLRGHSDRVRSVACSPDGIHFASGSDDRTIKIWEIQTGKCLKTLEGHRHWVRSVDISPDGKYLVSGSVDRTVKIWDISTGECLKTLEAHEDAVRIVRFSPDGGRVVTAGDDKTVRLWDGKTWDCIKTFKKHSHWVRAIAFSPNGQLLASGSADRTVRLWDLKAEQCIKTFYGYSNWIRSIALHPSEPTLVSASADQKVRVWNYVTGEYSMISALSGWVQTVAYSPDGKLLAAGGGDRLIYLYNPRTGQSLPLGGHQNRILSLSFSPDGHTLASASDDATIKLWNVHANHYLSGELIATLEGHQQGVRTIAFSPNGQRLASGSADLSLKLWDVPTGACLETLDCYQRSVHTLAFSPDGSIIASSDGSRVLLWQVQSNRLLRQLEGHREQVRALAFKPDGRAIASASSDRTIRIWDVARGQCVRVLEGHENEVCSIVFFSSGKKLASAGRDGTIRIWTLQGGEAPKVLQISRPYEGMNITGIQGLTDAQKASLITLGAFQQE